MLGDVPELANGAVLESSSVNAEMVMEVVGQMNK